MTRFKELTGIETFIRRPEILINTELLIPHMFSLLFPNSHRNTFILWKKHNKIISVLFLYRLTIIHI